MVFRKYFINEMDKFYYFIIMPAESSNIFDRQSLFNRFSSNIIHSRDFLKIIAYLPSTVDEYFKEWPLSVCNYETDCKNEIVYIYDYNIDDNLLINFSRSSLGCIFVLDDVNSTVLDKIIEISKMPIVSSENKSSKVIPFGADVVKEIYSTWNRNLNKVISEQNLKNNLNYSYIKLEFNKSSLKGITNESSKFLDPINMCIDKLRGSQVGIGSNLYTTEYANGLNNREKEKKADRLLVFTIKRFISEKLILLMLGFIEEGSFDEDDSLILSKLGITKSILDNFLTFRNIQEYEKLCTKVMSNFSQVSLKTDMVICMPSINYLELNEFNNLLGKYKWPPKLLKALCDTDVYYEKIDDYVSDKCDIDLAKNLLKKRGIEKEILSLMYVFYALPRKMPFIRMRNVPTSILYENVFNGIRNSYLKYDIDKMNIEIDKVNKVLFNSCYSKLWAIINKHSNHIKVLSDMPAEWIQIDKIPLCMLKKISRVPITPGNGLIGHSYFTKKFEININNLGIIIINALPEDEHHKELSILVEKLNDLINEQLNKISKECVYIKVNTKDELIEAITVRQPTIMIYYGHGSWNKNEMQGYLHIGNEVISSIDLEKINPKPLITVLGACETEVNYGSHLNIGNLLIGSGCPAVIGTHLPIRGNHAVSFISELIRNLVLCFTKKSNNHIYSWDEIILRTYQSHYILDVIISLEDLMNQDLSFLKYEYIDYCKLKNIEGIDVIKLRNDIFKEILKDNTDLYDMYLELLQKDRIIPLSLLYVSLGSPEKIIIKSIGNER